MSQAITSRASQQTDRAISISRRPIIRELLARTIGIAAGIGTHVLFGITVWYLYWFLSEMNATPSRYAIWIDLLLALQFAVPHSWLLHPANRKKLSRWITTPFYGLFFCVATCVSLLLTITQWRTIDFTVWQLSGSAHAAVRTGFVLSWVALFYSLWLSGLGYQTGLTPWLAWVRHQPLAKREFDESGWYRWFRHPIYLSFLGLIWFTPRMTLDHALLTGIWTIYIFIGSWLKDRRLEFYLGETYREYETRVPGYPFMTWGPLGLRRAN